jgi:hypothetical protein
MYFLKITLILCCFFINSYTSCSQTKDSKSYKLVVNLEKAPFDSLYLYDYTEGRNIRIAGNRTKKFTWEFSVQDSLVWNSEDMRLVVAPFDSVTNSTTGVRFFSKTGKKDIFFMGVGVEDRTNYIHGSYRGKNIFHEQYFKVKINNKDSIIEGDMITEDFNLIINDTISDIAIRAQNPFLVGLMKINRIMII